MGGKGLQIDMKSQIARLTSYQILGVNASTVLRDVCPAVNLQGAALILWNIIRLEGSVPANLDTTCSHIVNEQAFYHALVNKENIGVKDVDDGRVVDLAAKSM